MFTKQIKIFTVTNTLFTRYVYQKFTLHCYNIWHKKYDFSSTNIFAMQQTNTSIKSYDID